MKTSPDASNQSPSADSLEKEWMQKKEALLERLLKDKNSRSIDSASLAEAKERFASEVGRLEDANHSLARQVMDLQRRVAEKRNASRLLSQRVDARKQKLVRALTRERNLLNEIDFFKSEKSRLEDIYRGITQRLDANISALDNTFRNIEFIKGELKAVIDKMTMLEQKVPLKYRDVDNLEEQVAGTVKALQSLFDRMLDIEVNLNISYYKNKKPRWSSYDNN